MITYNKTILSNGLTLITHQENATPLVSVNLLYNVGARDENPNKTGFAHLFEHLMFGGSKNIPDYDYHANKAGAENNAFTNNDITNYYISLPKQYLETALWLESDRMNELIFSEKSLEVQRNVVIEEFRQRFLNQPYGDVWLLLRPLAYKVHPYQWSTIGKDISHIENATMDDVKQFFYTFYRPNNAILSIAGNIDEAETIDLVKKWFEPIPAGNAYIRQLPQEPKQTEARSLTVHRDVPSNAIYKAYKMSRRMSHDYYAFDLMSDILSNGSSSRLYTELVKKEKLFTEINAYITGDIDEGLFIFVGKLAEGVEMTTAENAILAQIERLKNETISEQELEKVKNKLEITFVYSQYKVLDRAMNLGYFDHLGNIDLINSEPQCYAAVSPDDIKRLATETFLPEQCSTLYYLKKE
ncbi:MAG: insulinase family protein [Bacteroidales bacterium]|nr:insulinase family protein [Bacteroidales bacterium]